MRISDWSSDVCSSDLGYRSALGTGSRCDIDRLAQSKQRFRNRAPGPSLQSRHECGHIPPRLPQSLSTEQPYKLLDRHGVAHIPAVGRSEEHTSELQSLMRISYAVFCLTKKTITKNTENKTT